MEAVRHGAIAVQRIAILGAGAWGQTLATLIARNGCEVSVWSRQGNLSLAEAVAEADAILAAVSVKGVASAIAQLQSLSLPTTTILASATKGLDPETTCTPTQLWQAAFPAHPIVAIAGPNLAREIQHGLPAATVVASTDPQAARGLQVAFSSPDFRVYTNPDPLGVELGGVLKNVMAIAAGVCDGLQLGTNAKAALTTRGLAEMIRLGTHWGAQPETFYGLSGLGDLLATCNSPLSRNYQVGFQLAQGKTLNTILEHLEGTAEGVNTAAVLVQRAEQHGISIPISRQVYDLLQGNITPQQAVASLMLRDVKPEYGAS